MLCGKRCALEVGIPSGGILETVVASPGDVAVVGQIVHKEVELDETRLRVFRRYGSGGARSGGSFRA